ncbi:hypothetical protein TTRE_0000971101 [Trichuris trichiura]|uniref:Uncharacterized protein n=1 Tax=Trichuris trichiura TaxID=36087 RepID=A0A077ZN82_TRITR|nr:hypothetical protein TTRE_0000971101 [Trichuris trichiura]
MVYKWHHLSKNHFEVLDRSKAMKLYLAALLFGIAFAGDDDKRLKGVGPGYEKSYLDYAGKFKGGARKFLPIYQKEVSEEKEVVVKGGCGAKEEEKKEPREKRSCGEKCDDLRGVGPGYEKSFLDYAGKFKGGARKFLPIYQKEVSEEKEVVVKGGCGAKEEEKKEPREKRCSGGKSCDLRGVGPGYEKSYLDYDGHFKGGARKFLPIYQKEVSEEKEVVVKGGCGAKEEEKKEPREKRSCGEKCDHLRGVGPGYEKSYLDYAGKFKGGARKFLPIYQKEVSEEKEVVVKGGCGAKEEEKKEPREKRCSGGKSCDLRGVGPGYEKSYLDYDGHFKGGARKFLPIYKKQSSAEKEVVIKGGAAPCPKCGKVH